VILPPQTGAERHRRVAVLPGHVQELGQHVHAAVQGSAVCCAVLRRGMLCLTQRGHGRQARVEIREQEHRSIRRPPVPQDPVSCRCDYQDKVWRCCVRSVEANFRNDDLFVTEPKSTDQAFTCVRRALAAGIVDDENHAGEVKRCQDAECGCPPAGMARLLQQTARCTPVSATRVALIGFPEGSAQDVSQQGALGSGRRGMAGQRNQLPRKERRAGQRDLSPDQLWPQRWQLAEVPGIARRNTPGGERLGLESG
jgi:hypothetical protein